jgi:hypothetical protein
MSAFFHSAPEKGDIWSMKYAFDLDTIVRHKDELTGLGCFIKILLKLLSVHLSL